MERLGAFAVAKAFKVCVCMGVCVGVCWPVCGCAYMSVCGCVFVCVSATFCSGTITHGASGCDSRGKGIQGVYVCVCLCVSLSLYASVCVCMLCQQHFVLGRSRMERLGAIAEAKAFKVCMCVDVGAGVGGCWPVCGCENVCLWVSLC